MKNNFDIFYPVQTKDSEIEGVPENKSKKHLYTWLFYFLRNSVKYITDYVVNN